MSVSESKLSQGIQAVVNGVGSTQFHVLILVALHPAAVIHRSESHGLNEGAPEGSFISITTLAGHLLDADAWRTQQHTRCFDTHAGDEGLG